MNRLDDAATYALAALIFLGVMMLILL